MNEANVRDIIFISHATPEDNEFTIWLSARLEALGYRTWIDKKELLGGETFWEIIQSVISTQTIKFLLVYSDHICYPGTNEVKKGIQKEIELATKMKEKGLKDFFIILNIDNSPFDLFPGSNDINQISFGNNWAEGLLNLEEKLVHDDIPKVLHSESGKATNWYLENYLVKNPIVAKKELFYSNWWSIRSLPTSFFIKRYKNETQADAVAALNPNCLLVKDANCITSFTQDLKTTIVNSFGSSEIEEVDTFELKIKDLLAGYNSNTFPSSRDAENHLKKLLKRSLHNFLKNNQLSWYDMANKNQAYYHTYNSLPSTKVKFDYPYRHNSRPKTKNLFGRHLDIGKWHFAVSAKPSLYPYLGFHLKSHIIFTKTGYNAILDQDLQHANRRKKGKRMFNEDWRDLLLAFIKSLEDDQGNVIIPSNTEYSIEMKSNLEMFWSDFGYFDPKDLKRQEIFINEEKEYSTEKEQTD